MIELFVEKKSKGGFPIKKPFAIGTVVIWNLLFLFDIIPFFIGKGEGFPIGNGILSAAVLLFLTALLSLVSFDFRRLILKEGRDFKDIKKFAYLILVISGFMLLNFGILSKVLG